MAYKPARSSSRFRPANSFLNRSWPAAATLPRKQFEQMLGPDARLRSPRLQLHTNKDDESPAKPIHRDAPKVGRNELCPCGSGKKFKRATAPQPKGIGVKQLKTDPPLLGLLSCVRSKPCDLSCETASTLPRRKSPSCEIAVRPTRSTPGCAAARLR